MRCSLKKKMQHSLPCVSCRCSLLPLLHVAHVAPNLHSSLVWPVRQAICRACCVHRYVEALPGKQIGFHGHHNQQLGMANSIDAITEGANMVDGSILGLGRGAGNTPTENVLCFLRNPKYNVRPIFDVVENQFYELKKTVLRQPLRPSSTAPTMLP